MVVANEKKGTKKNKKQLKFDKGSCNSKLLHDLRPVLQAGKILEAPVIVCFPHVVLIEADRPEECI